jgi:hypothetical protein
MNIVKESLNEFERKSEITTKDLNLGRYSGKIGAARKWLEDEILAKMELDTFDSSDNFKYYFLDGEHILKIYTKSKIVSLHESVFKELSEIFELTEEEYTPLIKEVIHEYFNIDPKEQTLANLTS